MARLNYNDFQTAGDSDTFVYNGKVYNCLSESRDEENETAVILVEQGKRDWQYVVEFDRDTNTIKNIEEKHDDR